MRLLKMIMGVLNLGFSASKDWGSTDEDLDVNCLDFSLLSRVETDSNHLWGHVQWRNTGNIHVRLSVCRSFLSFPTICANWKTRNIVTCLCLSFYLSIFLSLWWFQLWRQTNLLYIRKYFAVASSKDFVILNTSDTYLYLNFSKSILSFIIKQDLFLTCLPIFYPEKA
jgi:hypothetical protein